MYSRTHAIVYSFLDDLDRIARRDYQPSDDDVVRARLRTLGVQEYRITFETSVTPFAGRLTHSFFIFRILIPVLGGLGGDGGKEWLLYDVGGSRTMVRRIVASHYLRLSNLNVSGMRGCRSSTTYKLSYSVRIYSDIPHPVCS
jgi:hypothetical protein